MFLEILKISLPFVLAIIVHYLTLHYEEKKYYRSILRERVDQAYSKFYISFSFGLISVMANENKIMSDFDFLKNFSKLNDFLVENIVYFETKSQKQILEFHNAFVIVESALKNNHNVDKELQLLRQKAISICNQLLIEYKHLCNKLKLPSPITNNI